jgi:pSer/pThr/pTyr-binding forkhead associated (FHA) protein
MDKKTEDAPLLVAQSGPLNGQRWPVKNRLVIGRGPMCDIVIADRQVSRQHAQLSATARGIILEDLNSKNGTLYNGQTIEDPVILEDGGLVQIAVIQQFLFLSSDATVPLDSEIHTQTTATTGRLRLDKRSRRVWIGDQEVLPPLSLSQFSLLETLYEHQGLVVTRAELIKAIWGEEQAIVVSEQALDALVRRLRDRLNSIDPDNAYISTIRGHGLRLDNPSQEDYS